MALANNLRKSASGILLASVLCGGTIQIPPRAHDGHCAGGLGHYFGRYAAHKAAQCGTAPGANHDMIDHVVLGIGDNLACYMAFNHLIVDTTLGKLERLYPVAELHLAMDMCGMFPLYHVCKIFRAAQFIVVNNGHDGKKAVFVTVGQSPQCCAQGLLQLLAAMIEIQCHQHVRRPGDSRVGIKRFGLLKIIMPGVQPGPRYLYKTGFLCQLRAFGQRHHVRMGQCIGNLFGRGKAFIRASLQALQDDLL